MESNTTAVKRDKCDMHDCKRENVEGTEYYHNGTPVLFVCSYCDPKAFAAAQLAAGKVTVTLTLEELESLVCNRRTPLWLEHRYLCHPERECEDGCDVQANPERLHRYQDGQGCDPAFGGERTH